MKAPAECGFQGARVASCLSCLRECPLQLSNDAASAELLASKQPSKTFATPEDIGELAAFLCSRAANQITGV